MQTEGRTSISLKALARSEPGKQGDPTIETLKKIAKALNTPIEDLIK